MEIQVNGEKLVVENPKLTVSGLLHLKKVEAPERVSVQLNGQFVDKKVYDSTEVKDKDEVDFLYFLGGGSIQ